MSAETPSAAAADTRSLAFLEGPLALGGLTLRPISFMSVILARHMALSVVLSGGYVIGLTAEELSRQIDLFVWMQSTPEDEVIQCIREDNWHTAGKLGLEDGSFDLTAIVLSELTRHRDLIEAADFEISGAAGDKNPFHCHGTASAVFALTGGDVTRERYVLWHLPLARAILYQHCAVRSRGHKTRRPGEKKDASSQLKQAEEAAASQESLDAGW